MFIVKGYHRGCFISPSCWNKSPAPCAMPVAISSHLFRAACSFVWHCCLPPAAQHKIHSAVPHKTSKKTMKLCAACSLQPATFFLPIVLQLLAHRSLLVEPATVQKLHRCPAFHRAGIKLWNKSQGLHGFALTCKLIHSWLLVRANTIRCVQFDLIIIWNIIFAHGRWKVLFD